MPFLDGRVFEEMKLLYLVMLLTRSAKNNTSELHRNKKGPDTNICNSAPDRSHGSREIAAVR